MVWNGKEYSSKNYVCRGSMGRAVNLGVESSEGRRSRQFTELEASVSGKRNGCSKGDALSRPPRCIAKQEALSKPVPSDSEV